jgi:hypothetical protein
MLYKNEIIPNRLIKIVARILWTDIRRWIRERDINLEMVIRLSIRLSELRFCACSLQLLAEFNEMLWEP